MPAHRTGRSPLRALEKIAIADQRDRGQQIHCAHSLSLLLDHARAEKSFYSHMNLLVVLLVE